MIAKREALPIADRMHMAQAIKMHFADHPYLTYANSFAGYYAIRVEVDTLPIFNHMAKFNKKMCLPRIAGPELRFHCWAPGQAFDPTPGPIKMPMPDSESMIPEVILCPLLAFDNRGYRLGYGGGYYDRVMEKMRRAGSKAPLFVGVAYTAQEVPELPAEAHDMRLDGILTETGVSVFS